ncbi:MAG TPA: tail fiber domain-containing protein, partial [Candidatus Paceibacterota bacterium]|nr:tail fiber domain-containing protein [Candidatus Paceibacterota bacterium]
NYGNHDGAGSAQTKRAIRLGSAIDNEWDINTLNVGDRSIAIGFHSPTGLLEAPTATGDNSIAIGVGNDATGYASTALGFESNATGDYSFAFGGSAQGDNSVAFNKSAADGNYAFSAGRGALASSYNEISLGTYDTIYSPVSVTAFNVIDRLFNVGNGTGLGSESDAFTILKNGKTSIGYDNFETTTLDSLLQVNGSILSADLTGCDSLSSDADGKILCSGVTNGLGMISGSIGLGGTLTQNTTINQDIYSHTLLQPVSTTGALVMTQGLTTVTGLPGNVIGYIATNGDSARTISWASGASNKDLHTLSGSGDPDLLSGGSEIRTDYDITDTSSGMASLYAFDTPNGRTSRLQVTPTYLNIILDPAGELRINNSAGTAGYVLASNGAGVAPTWQDPNLLVSDERLKSNVTDLSNDTLSKLSQIRTVMYTLNTDQTNRMQVGFLAQDLEQYFPELVGQKDATYKGVYYAQMTPVLVQAIRELNLQMTEIDNMATANPLRDSFTAWLADQANGIVDLYAEIIHSKKVETEQLCIEDICMDRDQLYNMMQSSSTPVVITPPTVTPDPETDPVITPDSEIDSVVDQDSDPSDPVSDEPTVSDPEIGN